MEQQISKPAFAAAAAAATDARGQYLTFSLDGETFGMNILNIKEIIEFGNVTAVPMMPDFIQGVINLRGCVVPVVNLSLRFGKPAAPVGKRTCIVIIETECGGEAQDLGVVVDAVNAVLEIDASDIERAPSFGARLRTDFIAGMAKVGQRFVILVNVAKVLSLEDMATLIPMPGVSAGGAAAEVSPGSLN